MTDSEALRLAMALGRRARLDAPPNPWVGAVVVRDGRVIGEGWTQPFGGAHAEVVALEAAGQGAQGATMYVTLEPCAHQGKTPPCVDAILAAGISRVVAPISDPDERVAGSGFARLRESGVHVDVGLDAEAAVDELLPYLVQRRSGYPWVTAKVAMTLDANVADRDGVSKWITSAEARNRGHELRAQAQAVLVGATTMEVDHPLLTARPNDHEPTIQPERWVLSRHELSYCTPGVRVTAEAPRALLDRLGTQGVLAVLIEGGPTLEGSFLAEGLVDELVVYIAPLVLGDDRALRAFRSLTPLLLDDAMRFTIVGASPVGPDLEVRLHSVAAEQRRSTLIAELSRGQ